MKHNYCHCLEVASVDGLKASIEAIVKQTCTEYTEETITEFITTLQIICTDDVNDDEVYHFDIETFLKEIL